MKTLYRCMAAAILFAGTGCEFLNGAQRSTDPLIARAHFIGTQQLFAEKETTRLKEIWSQPGAEAFREETLEKFSRLPALLMGGARPNGSADNAALFRPLLEDLLTHESFSEFRATPEMVIAVKLPEARAKAWDANLKQAATSWKLGNPATVNGEGFVGWEIKRRDKLAVWRVGRSGEWTVVAAGPEGLALAAGMTASLKAQGAGWKKSGAWLDGSANLARFDRILPALGKFQNVPVAHFSLSNRTDFVRTLVTLDFPKAHGWKAEPWKIPTNSIYDPLSTFTAIRGVGPLLEAIPQVRQIGWKPTPSQISGWGLRRLPFQFYYATPAQEVTNQLRRIQPKLNELLFKQNKNLVGEITQGTNGMDLYWQGLPLAVPRLFPLRGDPAFLGFEVFPLAATKTRAPKELFQQLSRDNLVYYDWEITEDRIPSWRQAYQLSEIATRRQLTSSNAPSSRFIFDVTPKLGEAVTELTATSPTQMTLVRKSHLGLTSFELVTLTRWIESTNFPAFGVFPPQPPRRTPARPAGTTSPQK